MLDKNKNDFFYAMKRSFDIGCQPVGQKGLVSSELLKKINEDIQPNIEFKDIVRYENRLSEPEIIKFELKPISYIENKWRLV